MKERFERFKTWCKIHKEKIYTAAFVIGCEVMCAEMGWICGFSVGRVRGLQDATELLNTAEELMYPGD